MNVQQIKEGMLQILLLKKQNQMDREHKESQNIKRSEKSQGITGYKAMQGEIYIYIYF